MTSKNQKITDEEIARIAGEAGAKAALAAFEQEKQKAARGRRDRRLRNTKLLLKNYRMLKAHCENAVYTASQLDEDIDFVELMETVYDGNMLVESVKRSAERTYLIIRHVDEMLRTYQICCVTSGKPEEQRRYNTLYHLYIAESPSTVLDIAEMENVDQRTVYKDINSAVEKLTALIFGIDGMIPV